MKVVIVGGGASGLLIAIAIKRKHKDYQVTLLDKNEKLGKKLRATGGGKANIANIGNLKGKYFNQESADKLFKSITPNDLIQYFHDIGIETINYGDYVFPFSESSNAFTDSLIRIGEKLGVKYHTNVMCLDYKDNILLTTDYKYDFDILIIASGLGSSTKLGADSSFVFNLYKHGYNIKPIKAVLTPIRTIESTKEVDGIRRRVNIKAVENDKEYFNEDGELIFKKDGIGGIVIYHLSSFCLHNNLENPEIIIDFIPNKKFNGSLEDYFPSQFIKYISKYKDPKRVIYHIKNYYGEIDSVASMGGVSLNDVDDSFKSKMENNVYIIGEALDQDALCGGYNLMWAFITALKAANNI